MAGVIAWTDYIKKESALRDWQHEAGLSVCLSIHKVNKLSKNNNRKYADVCRMQFVPQIVNGLMKLGLHNQASPENRKLSLDLAGLIIYWEQRRLAESRSYDPASLSASLPGVALTMLETCLGDKVGPGCLCDGA